MGSNDAERSHDDDQATNDQATNEQATNGTDETRTRSTAQDETVGPDISQEDLDRAGEKMDGLNARYETGARECVTVEGTGGTVSGTAFADWDEESGSATSRDEKSENDDEKAAG